jgi:hypothetical protein
VFLSETKPEEEGEDGFLKFAIDISKFQCTTEKVKKLNKIDFLVSAAS